MKKFPYSFPELAFILLVMVFPLAVGLIWRSETMWGFVGKIAGSMVVGFLIWLGIISIIARSYDRKKQNDKTLA